MTLWHNQSTAELASLLVTDTEKGLTDEEVAVRLVRNGPNKLQKGKRFSAFVILASQFKSLVIWVLIGAAAISSALGETVDGIAIIAIVILNALIGFIQEYRAEKVAALADMVAPHCRVVRNGHSVVVAATEIVPGDILLLEGGSGHCGCPPDSCLCSTHQRSITDW